MKIKDMDIRVHEVDRDVRKQKAALSTYRFIRRQVEYRGVSDKVELARQMWEMFFTMEKAGLIACPRTTKSLLRSKLAFYRSVGVDETTSPSLLVVA